VSVRFSIFGALLQKKEKTFFDVRPAQTGQRAGQRVKTVNAMSAQR
jgi:hypothetical protein